ncbi:MAG: phage holin family protein [Gemmatimonadota bacterium]
MLVLISLLVGLVILALALALAAFVVPGIECQGPLGLVLAAVVYQALFLGITMLLGTLPHSLGPAGMIVELLVEVGVLWLVGQVVPGYRVDGFASALFGAIMIWMAQFAVSALFTFTSLAQLIHPA